ncbi:hypothetical protein [Thermoactinospora rubra]|uniref:hypothetical protein n=1 Tax=Thermoactinospora rubra TaxID=1088767 RepID=UPI000A10B5DC|nr:hypothetical protein [Thermoactinospora rubra]
MGLQQILPRWHFREVHRTPVYASREQVFRAIEDLTWAEVPVFRALMALRFPGSRRRPSSARVLDGLLGDGFAVLDRDADEIVVGTVARLPGGRRVALPAGSPGTAMRDLTAPDLVKIAMSFRLAGAELVTETRVLATSARARLLFRPYWLVVRLPSGLIRRVWLAAVRRRAEAACSGRPPA